MGAIVWTSNFSSGYNQANCKECGWKGQRYDAGGYGHDKASLEAHTHNQENHS